MLSLLLAPTAAQIARCVLLLRQLAEFGLNFSRDSHSKWTDGLRLGRAKYRLLPDPLRVMRAIYWATCLAELLAGRYHLPAAAQPHRQKPIQNVDEDLQGDEEGEEKEEEEEEEEDEEEYDRERNELGTVRAMHHAFRTRPIGVIVARFCRDFGVTPTSDLWPAELIALTQTPAEWAAALQAEAVKAARPTWPYPPPSHRPPRPIIAARTRRPPYPWPPPSG